MATDTERLIVALEAKINSFEKAMAKAAGIANQRSAEIRKRFREVNKDLDGLFGRTATGIRTALAAIGLSAGISSLTQYADAWTNAANRIKAAGVPMEDIARRQAELIEVAKRSRTEFGAVVDLYSRLSMGATELGASQDQIIRATETVSKLLSMSGANASEARGAIVQFAQGLAAGTLRGDELNSVLEQSYPLAQIIAKEFGVTVGQLKKLGEEGKLSASRILKALIEASAGVDQTFSQTRTTVAQAMTNLRTALVQYIGGLDEATGASGLLAGMIDGLANNFDDVAKAAAIAGAAIAAGFAPGAISGIASGLAGLSRFLVANPWIAAAVAIGTAAAALATFGDEIRPIQGEAATIIDYLSVAWNEVSGAATAAYQVVSDNFVGLISMISEALGGVPVGIEDIGRYILKFANDSIGHFVALYNVISTVFSDKLPPAIADGMYSAVNKLLSIVEGAINSIIGAFNSFAERINAFGDMLDLNPNIGTIGDIGIQLRNPFEGAGRELGDALGQGIEDAYQPYIQNFADAWREEANNVAEGRRYKDMELSRARGGFSGGTPAVTADGLKPPVSPADTKKKKLNDYEREAAQIKRRTEALMVEQQAVGLSAAEIERRQAALALEQAAEKAGLAITDQRRKQIDDLAAAYAAQVAALEYARDVEGISDRMKIMREEIEIAGLSGRAARERAIALELENAAQRAGIALTAEQRQRIADLSSEYAGLEEAREAVEEQAAAWDELKSAAGDALVDILMGTESLSDSIKNLSKYLAEAALKAALLGEGPLAGLFGTSGNSGLLGLAGSALGSLFGGSGLASYAFSGNTGAGGNGSLSFGGPRAGGGPVQAGRAYLVGEKRPELFVPGRSGTIIPEIPDGSAMNRMAMQAQPPAQRVQTNFRQTIDLRGANGDETIARIARQEAQRGAAMALKESNDQFAARLRKSTKYGR